MNGLVLMDLFKAFECPLHELLNAKIRTYGISMTVRRLTKSCPQERTLRAKINSTYSVLTQKKQRELQDSFLGLLFFNIFINDLFLILRKSRVCN